MAQNNQNITQNRVEIFFTKMFSNIIFENRIVSTILYTLTQQLKEFQKKLDIKLNEDI